MFQFNSIKPSSGRINFNFYIHLFVAFLSCLQHFVFKHSNKPHCILFCYTFKYSLSPFASWHQAPISSKPNFQPLKSFNFLCSHKCTTSTLKRSTSFLSSPGSVACSTSAGSLYTILRLPLNPNPKKPSFKTSSSSWLKGCFSALPFRQLSSLCSLAYHSFTPSTSTQVGWSLN